MPRASITSFNDCKSAIPANIHNMKVRFEKKRGREEDAFGALVFVYLFFYFVFYVFSKKNYGFLRYRVTGIFFLFLEIPNKQTQINLRLNH